MKNRLRKLLEHSLAKLEEQGVFPPNHGLVPDLERPRQASHGDFSTNAALMFKDISGVPPRELAQKIVEHLPSSALVKKAEVAGPGFVNFFLSPGAYEAVVPQILEAGPNYGRSDIGNGRSVQVEFVSANPTGPLHVGHGRGAAYGAAVADLLQAVGYKVHREYYVNDAGRQMDILATSVWLRYLELCGEFIAFPTSGYAGSYVGDLAGALHAELGETLCRPSAAVFADLPPDEAQGGDAEVHIDALIRRAVTMLGAQHYRVVYDRSLGNILTDIRRDLEQFGVVYDCWFSERSLAESGAVTRAIERLRASDHVYEKEGALWFRSTDYGDEKDRVVVRENGQTTYFASDIAYHMDKLERGFQRVIDVWGADHHGYVPRVKAALSAIGDDPSRLDVLLVQFAILYRGGKRIQMSTRSGEFVTLRELRQEVGKDAARFFYVMRKCEQHMDFDLDLAKSQSTDNPVYYVQYAHARVCSVFRQLQDKALKHDRANGDRHLHLLNEEHERQLLTTLARYPDVVEGAALVHEPHQLCHYLRELANDFHTYYNAHTFLVDRADLRDARLNLIDATRQVIANGLGLLSVSAPASM
ncbi:MAG: arginine--tRNA ligase [Acidiferrobacterales bacterium]|nr:arginine--tRNA ligase [Acidiferrobacterales bacterium]